MELFNDIHNRYFYIISAILTLATNHNLTSDEITATITRLGFAESPIFLTPMLQNDNGNGYCLLKKTPEGYASILKSPPFLPTTDLQKRWLKTMLNDKRILLFMDTAMQKEYIELLADISPLYCDNSILTIDKAGDGDDYENAEYQSIFKTILQAIREKKRLLIAYESGKNSRITAYFSPYKLEYSLKDDKFRLCAVRMQNTKMKSLYNLNLARIKDATLIEQQLPANLIEFVKSNRMPQPIEIEISNERNGFERVFTQLSNFERISTYDETTKHCLMKIYYYSVDEMELLITLLSFGPIIRVIGPEKFRAQIAERLSKQKQLSLITRNRDTIDE